MSAPASTACTDAPSPPAGRTVAGEPTSAILAADNRTVWEPDSAGEAGLAAARVTADDILATARDQAARQLETAQAKSEAQAQRIVAEAHEQLDHDIRRAQTTLKQDSARLVASATEAVLGQKLSSGEDQALIARSLEHPS